MPDYYFEFRRQQAAAIESVGERARRARRRVRARSAAASYGAVEEYRLDGADRAIVALGSTAGTVKDVVDELRDAGEQVGLLRILSFRPFPAAAVVSTRSATSTAVVGARPGGLARRRPAALRRGGRSALRQRLRAHAAPSTASAAATCIRPTSAPIFDGAAPAHIGLRGDPCRV